MKANLNTILVGITLAVMSWVGYETVQNGKNVAVVSASLQRIEERMAVTVERREYDLAMGEIRSRLATVEADIARMRLDFVKLQGK